MCHTSLLLRCGFRGLWPRRSARWLAVALALFIAACGATVHPTSTPAGTITPTPAPRVVSTRLLALLTGQLMMVGQCLRVESSYAPESLLLVWPVDITATVSGDTVLVSDLLLNKQATWRLGDIVTVGGGEIPSLGARLRQIGPATCPGPYYLVGSVDPSATPTATSTAAPSRAPAATLTPAPATPTLSPGVTEVTQDGIVTFTSTVFGITFSYKPSQFGANVRTRVATDRVYVYYDDNVTDPGQYVQVFDKAPGESLRQAIQKRILAGYDPQDCVLTVQSLADDSGYPHPDSYVYASILPRVPPTVNPSDDVIATKMAQAQKCPPVYTVAGGSVYFMEDTRHPNRFFFFKIGQYWIYSAGPPQYGYPWQDTFTVMDASQ